MAKALRARGVDSALEPPGRGIRGAFERDQNVTTGTASGKSLIFQCRPWTCSRATRAPGRFSCIPLKALAQDQARSLHAIGVKRARPAIYDGDTPPQQRADLRRRANVVLTNPDMLTLGILPEPSGVGRTSSRISRSS